MNWCSNNDILHARALVENFMASERGIPPEALRVKALRRLIELNSEPEVSRRRCVVAAFGLIAAGMELNTDDIAWLVRDRDIGFPKQPSFEI